MFWICLDGRRLVDVVCGMGALGRSFGRVLQTLCELLEQKGAFEAHLHDGALQAGLAQAGGIVGLFDVVQAALQFDALAIVGLFHRRRQWCVLGRICKWCFCQRVARAISNGYCAPGGAILVFCCIYTSWKDGIQETLVSPVVAGVAPAVSGLGTSGWYLDLFQSDLRNSNRIDI